MMPHKSFFRQERARKSHDISLSSFFFFAVRPDEQLSLEGFPPSGSLNCLANESVKHNVYISIILDMNLRIS